MSNSIHLLRSQSNWAMEELTHHKITMKAFIEEGEWRQRGTAETGGRWTNRDNQGRGRTDWEDNL